MGLSREKHLQAETMHSPCLHSVNLTSNQKQAILSTKSSLGISRIPLGSMSNLGVDGLDDDS